MFLINWMLLFCCCEREMPWMNREDIYEFHCFPKVVLFHDISVSIYFHLYLQLAIKPAGIARKVKLPLDIVIGTVPISNLQSPRTSYHPLPSTVSDNSCPFPFFENVSDQVCLTDKLSLQHMIPTAPPWEEDDDIPWQS